MKRSTSVTVGLVLAAGMSFACSMGEDDQEFMDVQADHQQVCVEEVSDRLLRVDDQRCPDDDDSGGGGFVYWYYLGRAYGASPPVGSAVLPGVHGSRVRPASGTVARPPSTGGFGTTRVAVAG